MTSQSLVIRKMLPADIHLLPAGFAAQGWHKPLQQFEAYYQQQQNGVRDVIIAEWMGQTAGYVCLLPDAPAGPFKGSGIPCINDFNVLIAYRTQGIGSALMEKAEALAFSRASSVCLGVGLHAGYGAAQRMYIKRGYVPDGSGVWYRNRRLPEGGPCCNDDELVLYLLKQRP